MKVENCNVSIPHNVLRIINKQGLKQKSVAEKAGFSKQQFSDMLNGRKIIKPCDALAIAVALGITMNDLYGIEMKIEEEELKAIETCRLVAELSRREGVEKVLAEPYERKEISIEGPAVALVVFD